MGLGALAVLTAGARLVADGQLARTALPLATLLAASSFLPVVTIVTVAKELTQTLGAARRFFAIEDEPVPVRDGAGAARAARQHVGRPLRDVTLRLRQRRASRRCATVSFEVPPGTDRRPGRPLGRGQDDRRAPAAAVLGSADAAAS